MAMKSEAVASMVKGGIGEGVAFEEVVPDGGVCLAQSLVSGLTEGLHFGCEEKGRVGGDGGVDAGHEEHGRDVFELVVARPLD